MTATPTATSHGEIRAARADLRRVSLRATPQRMAAMLVLYGAGGRHLSADDVWQAITHEHAIDRSTAYRILGDLCAAGLIHAVRLSDGLVRYEMRATVHHHAVCTGCGATVDVGIDAVAGLASALEHDFGFKLGAESLLLPGQCRDCSTR